MYLDGALQAWKEADAAAFEAERCLYAAWDAYRRTGGSVPAHLQHRATMARALARRRLNEAIAANKAAGQGGGCRPGAGGPGRSKPTGDYLVGAVAHGGNRRSVLEFPSRDFVPKGFFMMSRFLADHRDDLIRRCAAKVAKRPLRQATERQLASGIPLFLAQLQRTLEAEERHQPTESLRISGAAGGDALSVSEMGVSATQHGELLELGFRWTRWSATTGILPGRTDLAFNGAPFAVSDSVRSTAASTTASPVP
jgi:hypothetical protein